MRSYQNDYLRMLSNYLKRLLKGEFGESKIIFALFKDGANVFSMDDFDVGCTDIAEHVIDTWGCCASELSSPTHSRVTG